MRAILDSLLYCCSRRKSTDATPDERSQLIPPGEDGPSILTYDATTIDHQKAKERLHVIVKAKEGKMVRVLSRVPFNLRNDPMNGFPNSSSSRSNRSPSAKLGYPHNHTLDHPNERDSSRRSSPKPSPSLSRSDSASSVRQTPVSRISTSEDLIDQYVEHKLKVHLIPSTKSNQRAFSRRGRSKTRQGRFVEDADELGNAPTLEGIQSVDSGRGDFRAADDLGGDGEVDPPTVSAGAERPGITPLNDEESAAIKAISNELSATLKENFEDVGTLTRSWGD